MNAFALPNCAVVIADPHVSIREMVARTLGSILPCNVVGEAGTGLEALNICQRFASVLLIMELALPELCGLELLRRLKAARSRTRVLIFSGVQNRQHLGQALQ